MHRHSPEYSRENKRNYYTEYHVPLTDRLQDIIDERNEKLYQQRRENELKKYEKECAECTFTPKIKRTIDFGNNKGQYSARKVDDLFKWG